MYPITTCPTEFGRREKSLAARLVAAFESDELNRSSLQRPVTVAFSRTSRKVWLADDRQKSAVLHRGQLHDWHLCLSCMSEGIAEVFFADPMFGPKRCGYCGEKALWL